MHVREGVRQVMGVVVRLDRFMQRQKRAAIALLALGLLLLRRR